MKFRESETLELKKTTAELNKALESISAILNKHRKGELYFGIRNDGTVVGMDVSDKTIRDVSHAISESIEPKIYPEVKEVVLEGKHCIHVEFSGDDVPYFTKGNAYMRVGDENRQISPAELKRLILEQNRNLSQWDKQVCKEAGFKDISVKKLKRFLKVTGLDYADVENSLHKLNLVHSGNLLNSAVILFAHNPEKIFPNAKLRCAVFAAEGTAMIIDRQEFVGDLFELIDEAEKYILKNIHIGMRVEGMVRVDVPEIDREAFREVIINAFCHRDYYQYDSVNIAVFKNRVEIRSPGLLYGGLTIEKITNEMVSERRNELIADIFHRAHFIEKWGRGIDLIMSKEPDVGFKEVGRQFIVTFKRKVVTQPVDARLKLDSEIGVKVVDRVGEKVGDRVGKNEFRVLQLISDDNTISYTELAKALGISKKSVYKNVSKLKEKGLIGRIGSAKGGHWEVTDKSN
ncbi:ATP-binding protein [candidate division KSB1 bacterium]